MTENKQTAGREITRTERDVVALGIAAAAIIMFVGTGGTVLPQIARAWMGLGSGPDQVLVNALLLNVALIIFGWRRYSDLVIEIGERRKAEEGARLLAETDPLTGCLNRRGMADSADELTAATQASGREIAFIMLDLDNFKLINDLNGHLVGDAVLFATAERITALLPHDGLVARLGGDEFACVVPYDAAAPERVDAFLARLIDAVPHPVVCDSVTVEATISVGVAASLPSTDGAALDAQTLMHQADVAMYHAKKQGKNCYFWFEESMESELRSRKELETAIRRGIASGEFVPFYEQQIDLDSGELTGFEMLARWNSPQLGIVSPEAFIPVAEEMGLIGELSEMLIEQALADAKSWHPKLTLAINISPIQLRDPWFAQKLLKLLIKHNYPPKRLDVEITESCLHENIGTVRSLIASLRNQGVRISLDDFGTGYSSLAQLRSLTFDRLKIDRSFVAELSGADASSKIVSAIVSLGNGLELPITVEGIEDAQVLETLKQLGKLKGQGYHYGRPEDAAAVRARLEKDGLLLGSSSNSREEPQPTEPAALRKAAG